MEGVHPALSTFPDRSAKEYKSTQREHILIISSTNCAMQNNCHIKISPLFHPRPSPHPLIGFYSLWKPTGGRTVPVRGVGGRWEGGRPVVYKSSSFAPGHCCSVCSALNWDNHVPSSGVYQQSNMKQFFEHQFLFLLRSLSCLSAPA